MKMRAIKKMIIVVLLLGCAYFVIGATDSNATSTKTDIADDAVIKIAGIDDIINAGNNFINKGQSGAQQVQKDANENAKGSQKVDVSPEGFVEQFVDIGKVLVGIAIGTLVIVSMIMAFKWITATPDKQAKLKEQLIGLVIAAVVIFGAVGIWQLVRGIAENAEGRLASSTTTNDTVLVAQNYTKDKGGI